MMRLKYISLNLVLFTIALIGQGCVAAAVGLGAAGTIAYIRGDLESTEDKNIEVVYSAVLEAVEQLQLILINKSQDAHEATILARDVNDKKITIKMKSTSVQTTKLSIRVGTLGDEAMSVQIYQKIYNNLHPINKS